MSSKVREIMNRELLWLAQKPLWFRAAAAADPVARRQALETLGARGRHVEVNA
jgi:hypothetical protein